MPQLFVANLNQNSLNERQYDLLVVNLEIGIVGTVPVSAFSPDEAISLYERANPACAVISVLAPEHDDT